MPSVLCTSSTWRSTRCARTAPRGTPDGPPWGKSKLGYREVERGSGWVSLGDGTFYITLVQIEERFAARGFHRKGIGVNNLAFPAPSVKAVDDFHVWLVARGVPVLYGSPLDMGHPVQPNYAVSFEDPDRLKLEYVHRPG
jgi:catechol 2,3-dioxygenase-like lactoylglutathione lyase family enzyme